MDDPLSGTARRNLVEHDTYPFEDVSVTDVPYGAIDDGLRSYFVCTWTSGQTTLSAYLARVPVTIENKGPDGNGLLTFPVLQASDGLGIGTQWCGKPIAVEGAGLAGAILTTTVIDFYFDKSNVPTLVLATPAGTPLTKTAQAVSCPCFVPGDIGKSIWLSNAARSSAGSGNPTGSVMKRDIIAHYTSPFEIALENPISAGSVKARPGTLIVWGTDNSAAVRAAGKYALATGRQQLYFPGCTRPSSTGLFCLFDWITNNAPFDATDRLSSNVTGALHWFTSDHYTEVFVTSKTGHNGSAAHGRFQEAQHRKMAVPVSAPRRPHPKKEVIGAQSLRRCATLSTIVAVVIGDSWALQNSGGANGIVLTRLKDEIQRQNPGKSIRWVYRGIGGYRWQDIISDANIPLSADQDWITGGRRYLDYIENLPIPGLGIVTPDLIICMSGGPNDGSNNGTLWPNDIDTFFRITADWTKKNGYPPDVIMVNGATKTMELFVFASEYLSTQMEYVIGLNRSYARVNHIPLIDLATTSGFVTDGWAPDRHVMRVVPPLSRAPVTKAEPYSLQYQTRDFWVALQLFGSNGSDVWSRIGTLCLQLSPKPDNCLMITVDEDDNLTVAASTWGGNIVTPVTIASGSASLMTSGQTPLDAARVSIQPHPPSFAVPFPSNLFTSEMVGQCFYAPDAMPDGRDFRTLVSGYTNPAIICVSDATPSAQCLTEFLVGGHMFTRTDATAKSDVVLSDGHLTLRTKVADYISECRVTLKDAWNGPSLAVTPLPLFVGRLSVPPSRDMDIPAGRDTGPNPIVTVEKRGTRVKVGYILGSATDFSNTREKIRHNERIVWEGDVACFGGPFVSRVLTSAASPSTAIDVQAIYMMIGEREVFLPELTMRDAWGVADSAMSGPYGGDTSHPSGRWISRVVGDTIAAQDFSTGLDYSQNFGSAKPPDNFCYAVPANQAFTALLNEEAINAGTIVLPNTFPQGGHLELFFLNTIAQLDVSAPAGLSIQGKIVSAIEARGTICYRLIGTVFYRIR